jgi:hypothetical protein
MKINPSGRCARLRSRGETYPGWEGDEVFPSAHPTGFAKGYFSFDSSLAGALFLYDILV